MSRLPREFLWKDLESMEDFFVDPLNKELYHVYCQVKEAPFRLTMPDVEVFNELYYLCIALNNECISFSELDEEIESNFCRKNTTDLLIAMIYSVFSLQKKQLLIMDQFDVFLESYQKGWYFDYFLDFIKEHQNRYKTNLRPHPENAKLVINREVNWEILTNNFNKDSILRILDIWNNHDDKIRILSDIETSYRKSNGNPYCIKEKKTGGITTYTFNSVFQDIKDYLNAVNFLAHYEIPKKNPDPLTYPFIIHGEHTEEIEQKLHALLKGKTSPKDRMMPIRAAIDAGVIRRPTYTELQSSFGKDFVANSSYHNYTNPDKHPYDANPSFTLLVSEFKKIVE